MTRGIINEKIYTHKNITPVFSKGGMAEHTKHYIYAFSFVDVLSEYLKYANLDRVA